MPEISEFFIKTERTARVAQLGQPGPGITDCWIVLHGYQMLAGRFIQRFAPLANAQTLIVAPEGLSRFYLPGHKHVGASWMTKEDRLHEIEDQWRYLNAVQNQLISQLPPSVRWHLLGFSQGTATVWRWLLHGKPVMHSLTIWTGGVPPESNLDLERRISAVPLCYVFASNDEFIPERTAFKYGQEWQKKYPHLQLHRFEGKHEVLPAPLLAIKAHIGGHFEVE